jgi:hypothetical protein
MSNSIINLDEFKPIMSWIDELRFTPSKKLWLKILIPRSLKLDEDKCKQFFNDDLRISHIREENSPIKFTIEGTIKGDDLIAFIMSEYYHNGHR